MIIGGILLLLLGWLFELCWSLIKTTNVFVIFKYIFETIDEYGVFRVVIKRNNSGLNRIIRYSQIHLLAHVPLFFHQFFVGAQLPNRIAGQRDLQVVQVRVHSVELVRFVCVGHVVRVLSRDVLFKTGW